MEGGELANGGDVLCDVLMSAENREGYLGIFTFIYTVSKSFNRR